MISTKYEYWKKERKRKKALRSMQHDGYSVNVPGILGIAFIILFIANFFYSTLDLNQAFTFTGFLHALEQAPSVPIDWIKDFASLRITSDWSELFNWFRDFLNQFIMPMITVVLFLCVGIAQLVTYIVYFVGILFGGV